MMNRESSDEKLLKLIEGSAKVKSTPQAGAQARPAGMRKTALGISSIFSGRQFNSLSKLKLFVNLNNFNKTLFFAGGLLTLYFLYSFISGARSYNGSTIPSGKTGTGILKAVTVQESKFLDRKDYVQMINKRNVFLAQELKGTAATSANMVSLQDLLKDFKLVGIIWSSNPDVMIEGMKENRTYLLKKGDTFGDNKFKVKDILENSAKIEVTTEEGAKEYELR